MHPILARNDWLVDELWLELERSSFNLLDPATNAVLLEVREQPRHDRSFWFRFLRSRHRRPGAAPFAVAVRTPQGEPVATLSRETGFTESHVQVFDEQGAFVGSVVHKGALVLESCEVFHANGALAYVVKKSRRDAVHVEYHLLQGAAEVARVSKHWTGLVQQAGLEINKYSLWLNPALPPQDPGRLLILAAAICFDMVGGTTAPFR